MKKFAAFLLIILVVFSGCQENQKQQEDKELTRMANAPDAGPAGCGTDLSETAYNFTLSSFRDSSEITYNIRNYPAGMTPTEVHNIVASAFNQWQVHIPVPIRETTDSADADILIRFKYLDGIGGSMGRSDFPPISAFSKRPQEITIDRYDIQPVPKEGTAVYDFFTIALHEAGHSLGLQHSYFDESVMWPNYQEVAGLYTDDIIGIRQQYGNQRSFSHNGRRYLWIDSADRSRITPYFRANEFYTKCSDATIPGHYIDSILVSAVTQIRDYYGTPVQIISSLRNEECNYRVGGALNSRHLENLALDWKFVGPDARTAHREYQNDMLHNRCIFRDLLYSGVRGFGGYRTSNHIDTRAGGGLQQWRDISYAWWGTFAPHALNMEEDPLKLNELQ